MKPAFRIAALCLASIAMMFGMAASAQRAPDALVLGDSQLSFGAGVAFVDLLKDMAGECGLPAKVSTGVIGVRSSTITSWTGRNKKAKGAICNIDPKWKVNAGVYGSLSQGDNPYVQIGKGNAFQFCTADRSPLQAVFFKGYYRPKLLIMMLMGNATERWAGSAAAAEEDAQAFVANLPQGQPCVFMTSAPPFNKKEVALRQRAQNNIERAFAKTGSACSFVRGFTPETIRENQGNSRSFRRKPSGGVKDPFHPTEAAARKFLSLRRSALCKAIAFQLSKG